MSLSYAAAAGLCVLAASGCSSYKPQALDSIPLKERAETQYRDGLRVSVTVLSRDESKELFGVDLYGKQIQPVWIRIENETETPYWFMLHGLDPNYFSAREAAYKSHYRLRPRTNRKIDDHFETSGIVQTVPPLGATSGFAFSNVKLGTKEVRVRLLAQRTLKDFHFYVSVPGFRADHAKVDWDAYLAQTPMIDLETEQELLEVIENLPCCTSRKGGGGQGDPLNLIVIGPRKALVSLIRAGWDETELLTWSSGWKTFKAFFGGEYRYSPMSALYVDGNPQTLGLQKARDTIHERNHLRLWIAPWMYDGDHVMVGTITRDIGVYFTTRTWNLTTHAIDPDVDEARNYLVEDLITTESIRAFGAVPGVGRATKEEPHRNLMFAPWWTDGRRFVIRLAAADERLSIEEIDYFQFHTPEISTEELSGMEIEGGSVVLRPPPGTREPRDGGVQAEEGASPPR